MKIFFIKDIINFSIDYPEHTICIYHKDYTPPKLNGVKYFEFDEYKKVYSTIETECLIMVGLNKIVTPSSRCEFIHEYLSTLTPQLHKISIDTSPFIGEPWRLFYHYLYTNNNKFSVPHSYAIETEWKHWFYQNINDCRLSGENIKRYIVNTYSDIETLNSKYEFYDVDDEEWYNEAKDHVFETKDTPKTIINELLKLANKRYNLSINYDIYREKDNLFGEKTHQIPDLKIYRFVVNEAIRRQDIYNAVVS